MAFCVPTLEGQFGKKASQPSSVSVIKTIQYAVEVTVRTSRETRLYFVETKRKAVCVKYLSLFIQINLRFLHFWAIT